LDLTDPGGNGSPDAAWGQRISKLRQDCHSQGRLEARLLPCSLLGPPQAPEEKEDLEKGRRKKGSGALEQDPQARRGRGEKTLGDLRLNGRSGQTP
jgi:hypothetical protein